MTEIITPEDELVELRVSEDKNDLHYSTLLLRYMKIVKTYSLFPMTKFQRHFDDMLESATNYATLLSQVINLCPYTG